MTRSDYQRAVDALAKSPGPDPNGYAVDAVANVRECRELRRCCANVGYDAQSGSIYCEDPAVVIADVVGRPGRVVTVCERHRGRLKNLRSA